MEGDKQFLFSDDLRRPLQFCATIARGRVDRFLTRGWIPLATDPTATVTFVRFADRTYAVTANHVICAFHAEASKAGNAFEPYVLPASTGTIIQPPFLQPPGTLEHGPPDVALCPIADDLPGRIGKKAFKLENRSAAFPIPYALAAGFPTSGKFTVAEPQGEKLGLQGVVAVAEGVGSGSSGDQVQFYSEVSANLVRYDVSGISGGPVFWSDGDQHGLLGFVKEALPAQTASGSPRESHVHFVCQRADGETFKKWAEFIDGAWDEARRKLPAPR